MLCHPDTQVHGQQSDACMDQHVPVCMCVCVGIGGASACVFAYMFNTYIRRRLFMVLLALRHISSAKFKFTAATIYGAVSFLLYAHGTFSYVPLQLD